MTKITGSSSSGCQVIGYCETRRWIAVDRKRTIGYLSCRSPMAWSCNLDPAKACMSAGEAQDSVISNIWLCLPLMLEAHTSNVRSDSSA